MAPLRRIAEIAQRGLQGGSIGLESLLHYKDNLTCFIFSCMSGIEHYQNEYENGRTRGILRNDPLPNITNSTWWRMAYLIHPSRCLL